MSGAKGNGAKASGAKASGAKGSGGKAIVVAVTGAALALGTLGAADASGRAGTSGRADASGRAGVSGQAARLTPSPLARFRWSPLASSPLKTRFSPILVWAGQELIELGGFRRDGTTDDGAAFDPAAGRWHKIAPVRANVGFDNATTTWTGRQLFVTNGQVASCAGGQPLSDCLARAGLYSPAANRWTTTLLPKAMEGMSPEASAWTGREIVLAAVHETLGRMTVASYNPATRRWQVITPRLPKGHHVRVVALAVAAGRILLWAAWDHENRNTGFSGVDVMALPRAGRWRDVTGSWPQNHWLTAFTNTRRGILVSPSEFWCGDPCPGPFAAFPGFFANPVTLHRTPISAGPLGLAIPTFIWTGAAIIALNIGTIVEGPGHQIHPDDMALYNPATKRWSRLPTAPGRPGLSATPAWTGSELLMLTDSGRLLALRR